MSNETPRLSPQTPRPPRRRTLRGILLRAAAVFLTVLVATEITLQLTSNESGAAKDVLAQLQQIPTATLSDAVDQVAGRRGFMSYDMRPIGLRGRMAGRAKTCVWAPLKTDSPKEMDNGPKHGVEIIDESGPGDILVVVTGDLNITGLGGLMATTAKIRDMSGVVVDGAVRDVPEIEELGLNVFARSISPATMKGRAMSLARDLQVLCGGVTVSPGDYIVGDRDGVVCIPAGDIDGVLKKALEMEETEKKMRPMLYKVKSLQKAVQLFKRI